MKEKFFFCEACGTILDLPTEKTVTCTLCDRAHDIIKLAGDPLVSVKQFASLKTISEGDTIDYRATIEEICPKCGHNELWYSTAQTRSVDEGQTVFYECKKCHNRWSLFN